jgi:hypothetical protein
VAVGRRRLLRRLAAGAPAPVVVARGGGAGLRPVELAADPRVRLVDSPRHATVLVAAGRFPDELGAALDRLHDQLPAPRAVVWWTAAAGGRPPPSLVHAEVVEGGAAAVVAAVRALHEGVVLDGTSTPDVAPDRPPNPYEGRGDHGQGGEGMMGGVPFGRPMAMTGDDRDGLALDQLSVSWGPYLVGMPTGVGVQVVLQGDVVQHAEVHLLDQGSGPDLDDLVALEADVRRARHDLRWLAEGLHLAGLSALSARAAACSLRPDDAARRRLVRAVRRSGLLRTWSGVAVLDGRDAARRLADRLDPPGDRDRADVDPDRLASAIVGLPWAEARVVLWSVEGSLAATAVAA